MPKESIYESGDPESQSKAGFGSVEVTWGKDQAHVQVGARFNGQPFRFIGSPSKEPAAEDPVPAAGEPLIFESLHVTLTRRDQINELIRVLRRARDQAFGADA